jgi:hypothetical protein
MPVRVIDLDGSVVQQQKVVRQARAAVVTLRDWGPRLRLACSWRRFRRFERELATLTGSPTDDAPGITFYGSGDFHHLTLALLRRLPCPCNLLVLDKHPDWMCGIPVVHCGTWLRHASRLPQVARVFHVGGELDFDNGFRYLAPWADLRSHRITVFPAVRYFRGRSWGRVKHQPLREGTDQPLTPTRLAMLLAPWRAELAARPLYISFDKDVLRSEDAVVNWDSGWLTTGEALTVMGAFSQAAHGRVAGIDIVGDWSPVHVSGLFRRVLHWVEHPRLHIDPADATTQNERHNLSILAEVGHLLPLPRWRYQERAA